MWTTKTVLRIACIPLFVVGCWLLYYGTTMLFLVPGNPYESYWKSMFEGRFVYGVVPALASAILLAAVGWIWDRTSGSANLLMAVGRSFLLAWGAILLFWVAIIVIAMGKGSA
jgi:hypothetical protein